MAVLYRKYRPQTFADVINQKYIIQTLKNQIDSGSVAHAYLFTGSRGVGKTSVARIFSKAVNCPNVKQGEACGVCDFCKQVQQGNFMDLVEIDAASNTGVENIRELIEHVKFSPSVGKYKVFIIDEVHMLSKGAFNALLKTLEEPPKHAIFVLATTEINKVPSTIISRTQRFDFKALGYSDILGHLENICSQEGLGIKREVLELVAQNAEGSVRDALSLLDKITTLGQQAGIDECQQLLGVTDISVCENLLEIIVLGKAGDLPDFFTGLSEKGMDSVIFTKDFLEYLRKVLIFKITNGNPNFVLSDQHLFKISEVAEKFQTAEVIFIIRLFLKAFKDLPYSPSQEIPLLVASTEAALKKNSSQPNIAKPSEKISVQAELKPELSAPDKETLASDIGHDLNTPAVSMLEAEELLPKIVEKIKSVNGPLANLLRSGQLLQVQGNRILLGVKFLFDKQRLENAKNASLINSTLESLSGKKLALAIQLYKAGADNAEPSEILDQALKVFGGELVE